MAARITKNGESICTASGARQYKSPLAALAGCVGVEEWTEISLIRLELRALAGQVEELAIPDNEEEA